MSEINKILTYFKLNETERREAYLASNSLSFIKLGMLAVGYSHFAVLRENGTVQAFGNNGSGQCNVDGWKNVVKIAAGDFHTVALRNDGTVLAAGSNLYGQCNVSDWRNVTELFADKGFTVGITAEGKIFATRPQPENAASPQKEVTQETGVPFMKIADKLLFEYHIVNNKAIIDKYLGDDEAVIVPSFLSGYPVEEIGTSAFEKGKLKRLTTSVKRISKHAFAYCKCLETVQLLSGVEEIDSYAFMHCVKLNSMTLPNSVKKMGEWVFLGCSNLKLITGSRVLGDQRKFLRSDIKIVYR